MSLICTLFFAISFFSFIFQSALYSQVDKSNSLNAGFLYGVFKQFDDVYLKSALHFVRTNRLISQNKSINRNRGLLLPIGSGVFHLSLTSVILIITFLASKSCEYHICLTISLFFAGIICSSKQFIVLNCLVVSTAGFQNR